MNNLMNHAEIKAYPKQLTTGTVLTRLLDGLSFRYYWATEGLTAHDAAFDPGNESRTLYQTLNHLYNMIDFAGYILEGKVYPFPEKEHGFSLESLREKTLQRIDDLKDLFVKIDNDALAQKSVKVEVAGDPHQFSIWHLFNGPLVDCMFHLGQVTALRRMAGNPIFPGVQPFLGKRMAPNEDSN